MSRPKRANMRPLNELAEVFGVTRNTIYKAYERGQIGGVIPLGRMLYIKEEAFQYHAVNGYGRDVPNWNE
ncbi:helix-turn-helix domain-containing protein [Ruegeria sp. HKCCA4633]|uniref:helix-turn-helix domain-containing protein n=1 Tax=Ruegeria sp. HKCCA4633 TaxID=2682983 RepID=UPI001489001D|nr:helix-turn-helix domain-containing protein [Ruegeria sp. HKCCA4633]